MSPAGLDHPEPPGLSAACCFTEAWGKWGQMVLSSRIPCPSVLHLSPGGSGDPPSPPHSPASPPTQSRKEAQLQNRPETPAMPPALLIQEKPQHLAPSQKSTQFPNVNESQSFKTTQIEGEMMSESEVG